MGFEVESDWCAGHWVRLVGDTQQEQVSLTHCGMSCSFLHAASAELLSLPVLLQLTEALDIHSVTGRETQN